MVTKKFLTDLSSQTWDNRIIKKDKLGRLRPSPRVITKSSQEGLKEGWTRATFIVREDLLVKLKDLARWEGKQIKELVDEILSSHLKKKRIKGVQTNTGS